jgi:hypothetical protein
MTPRTAKAIIRPAPSGDYPLQLKLVRGRRLLERATSSSSLSCDRLGQRATDGARVRRGGRRAPPGLPLLPFTGLSHACDA